MQHITQLAEQIGIHPTEIKAFLGDPSIKQLTSEQAAKVTAHFGGDTPTEQPGELSQQPPSGLDEQSQYYEQIGNATGQGLESIKQQIAALKGIQKFQQEKALEEIESESYEAARNFHELTRMQQQLNATLARIADANGTSVDASLTKVGLPTAQQNYSKLVELQRQTIESVEAMAKKSQR